MHESCQVTQFLRVPADTISEGGPIAGDEKIRLRFRLMEEVSCSVVFVFVVVFFYRGGLVIYVADPVELRGQESKAKPPVEEHVADTCIRLYIETGAEIASAGCINGNVALQLSPPHL